MPSTYSASCGSHLAVGSRSTRRGSDPATARRRPVCRITASKRSRWNVARRAEAPDCSLPDLRGSCGRSDHLPDLVLHDRFENFPTVFLAFDEGFAEFDELFCANVARQGRFVRVNDSLDDGRSVVGQGLPQVDTGMIGASCSWQTRSSKPPRLAVAGRQSFSSKTANCPPKGA